jgi:hypothetical protein
MKNQATQTDNPKPEAVQPLPLAGLFCPDCGGEMRASKSGIDELPAWLGCDRCRIGGVGDSQQGALEMILHYRGDAKSDSQSPAKKS